MYVVASINFKFSPQIEIILPCFMTDALVALCNSLQTNAITHKRHFDIHTIASYMYTHLTHVAKGTSHITARHNCKT